MINANNAKIEMTPEERKARAEKAANARWDKHKEIKNIEASIPETVPDKESFINDLVDIDNKEELPIARWRGHINLMNIDLPCYVLSNGQRVIGRTSATELLSGIKGGGGLEKYIGVSSLKPFVNLDFVLEQMIPFRLPDVEGLDRAVKGLTSSVWIEICQGLVAALESHNDKNTDTKLTDRQVELCIKASMFLSACAKVGLDALIDEATGFQYERAQDALEVKLRAYLEEEMREWEKTFPDELWLEFGRLTGWKGTVNQRPKYWGKLVMELIYENLDTDVSSWLKENAPAPRHGKNYHQWLSGQYGLKKLVELIWMIIGISKTCDSMIELRDRVAELYGRVPIQTRLYLPMS